MGDYGKKWAEVGGEPWVKKVSAASQKEMKAKAQKGGLRKLKKKI
ncbi:MAG: hypothetical protein ABIA67_01215 [Candidatus Margulisiibacteriota bacterium]